MAPDDRAQELVGQLRAATAKAGRTVDAVGIDVHLSLRSVPEERWQAHVEDWRQLGATHLSVETMMAGFTSPQQHIDALRRVATVLGMQG
jgi:alkanesulfonate monooxygenase SsuD/methylene tetrahydromethanopterin reductase-like flavin-dependent oxidoreductase (luciferase family)